MSFAAQPLVIGHRGAAGLAPENTLQGFLLAAQLGVRAVELDVHCVHGRLLVIHDETLDRTTSGAGALASMDLAALRALDAGNGQAIPYLEEVLEALPKHVGVNVELKSAGTAGPVLEVLERFGHGQRPLLVSSFDLAELGQFTELAGGRFMVAPLFSRWNHRIPEIAAELDAWSVNLSVRAATRKRIRFVRDGGGRVLVFTVNDAQTAQRLFAWGAAGVFTDYPDRLAGSVETSRM